MRDQFVGDVTDWIKFSLLRALAGNERSLGIAWYYISHELEESRCQKLDKAVSAGIKEVRGTVKKLEELNIWSEGKGAAFFRKPVPHQAGRGKWLREMKESLAQADIVFLDPDNGLGEASPKHATIEDVEAMRKLGRTVVLIHFPKRQDFEKQLSTLHADLCGVTKNVSIFTIKTKVTFHRENHQGEMKPLPPRERWFAIIDGDETIFQRAKRFVAKLESIEDCAASIHRMKER